MPQLEFEIRCLRFTIQDPIEIRWLIYVLKFSISRNPPIDGRDQILETGVGE